MSEKTPSQFIGNYKTSELIAMLKWAKSLGVTSFKCEAFEATFAVEQPAIPDHTKPAELPDEGPPLAHQAGWQDKGPRHVTPVSAPANLCDVCRTPKVIGKWGKPYCVACFIAQKESKK